MQMRKKLLSMLVLLTAAAPGAWAQDEVTLTLQGEGAWTLVMPANDVELEVTYFTDEELFTDGVELTKNANGTWTLSSMPAFDVELEVEYKADLTLTVSIEGWTYGATASVPTVSGNESGGAVTYEYKVKGAADDTYTADVPTAAGDYTVRATVAETDDYADATATAEEGQTVTITYNGTKKVKSNKAVKKAATISFTVKRAAKVNYDYTDGNYTVAPGTTWQQFIDSGEAPACLSIVNGEVYHDYNNGLSDCGGTRVANTADKKYVKPDDAIIDGATYGCNDYLGYEAHD